MEDHSELEPSDLRKLLFTEEEAGNINTTRSYSCFAICGHIKRTGDAQRGANSAETQRWWRESPRSRIIRQQLRGCPLEGSMRNERHKVVRSSWRHTFDAEQSG